MNDLTVFSKDVLPVYTTDTGEKVVRSKAMNQKDEDKQLLLTTEEAMDILKRNNIKISYKKFCDFANAGIFPFAQKAEGHDWFISRKYMADWLRGIGGDINRCSNVVIWEEESA